MELWHIWLIASLVFLILEIFTSGFVVFCFAFGGVFGALGALCGLGIAWQIALFALSTAASFFFIRPLVMHLFFRKEEQKTNVDALIGRKAVVVETIKGAITVGRVKVDGDIWQAISEDGSTIEINTPVTIVGRDGIILTVRTA